MSLSNESGGACSDTQRRFWYQEQLEPGTPARNVFARWRLEGEVSTPILTEAWKTIVARHAVLRTRFINDDGVPKAVLEPTIPFQVREIDLSLLDEESSATEAERIAGIEALTPFDLTSAPLIRVMHVRINERTSIVMVTAHHIVADGWSFGILAREMGTIAASLAGDDGAVLPPAPPPYRDFVEREKARHEEPAFAADRAALRARMRDFRRFELAPDRPRPSIQTTNGDIASLLLDRNLMSELESMARTNNATLFMVAYAVFLVMLHERSGQSDITVSTQVTGRDDIAFEQTVGTFINTIPLRTQVDPDATFRDVLDRVRDGVSDALELRGVPMDVLIDIVREKRDLSRTPLFGVNFIFQRSFIENATYGSFRLVDLPSRTVGATYDLCFFMVERPEGWRLSCEFNTDLFERSTVMQLLARYEGLLRLFAREPSASLRSVLHGPAPAPRATDETIALAIADLLGVERIPYDEDIFAIGFHSLLAMRLLARVKTTYGIDLPLRALFEAPTVRGIAAQIDRMRNLTSRANTSAAIALLNPNGSRTPFFYFHSDITSDGLYCRRLAALLGPDQPVYAIAPAGTAGIPAFTTVEAMASDALQRIRALGAARPQLIGGYCIGGLVAYEVARLIQSQGETVERVVLVNSTALPRRTIPVMDALIRRIGANTRLKRKLRARICFNLAWLHAVLVSSPRRAAALVVERIQKIRNRREPLWRMSEYAEERRVEAERAMASINAASFTYHLKPFDGDVTLMWGVGQDVPAEAPASEWRSVARSVQLLTMPGNRFAPLNEEIESFASNLAVAFGR